MSADAVDDVIAVDDVTTRRAAHACSEAPDDEPVMVPFARDIPWDRWRLVRERTTVSEGGRRFDVRLPASASLDEDRLGHTSLAAINDYFLTGRALAIYHSDFCTMPLLDLTHGMFLLQTDLEVLPQFYAARRAQSIWLAMHLTVRLHSVGRSSFALVTNMHDDTGALLGSCIAKLARVSMMTRRSEPLPEAFRAEHTAFSDPALALPSLPDTPVPPGSFSAEFVVRPSDTDHYRHVNYGVYVSLCLDCAMLALGKESSSGQSYLPHFVAEGGDVCSRLVRSVRCSYMREQRLGAVLRVSVWEGADPDTLHFRVSSTHDDRSSMLCVLSFHHHAVLAKARL